VSDADRDPAVAWRAADRGEDPGPLERSGSGEPGFPVAMLSTVRRYVLTAVRRERRASFGVVGFFALASIAALVGPQVLGQVISTAAGKAHSIGRVELASVIFAAALVVQGGAATVASRTGGRLSARLLARLREDFVRDVLDLPVGVVERAGTGELQTRASSDVEQLTWSVRQAAPKMLVAMAQCVAIVVALLVTAPLLGLVLVPVLPFLVAGTRWYLGRARPGYQRTMAAWDQTNGRVQETAAGGRTIETLGLSARRVATVDADIARWIETERYTLRLRTIYFPLTEACYVVPLVLALLAGGFLYADGHLSLAATTASVLYVQLLVTPVDTVLSYLDEIQLGAASLARLLGVREVPVPDYALAAPSGSRVVARDVHYAYRPGHDVLRAVDLDPEPGSRVVLVGPSGAGKSTFALLLTGVHAPRTGYVRVGGVDAYRVPAERLRREIALVTQEYHVFNGTLRENLSLSAPDASDEQLLAALAVVGAGPLVGRLPDGLHTVLGPGAVQLSPGESQQVALARLVLADPHTLVLDEATALLDPRVARHLERSLSGVLEGRTVVAVAHRLDAARDADQVVVVDHGEVVERGTHEELLRAGGSYAALWHSWEGALRQSEAGANQVAGDPPVPS
jgi:ABC-type multidrug transport system fused ATPase/permease subunit